MWKTLRPYWLIASAALNAAFVAVWLAHAGTSGSPPVAEPMSLDQSDVWCPLHRQLQVTRQQWSVIEPRLLVFQEQVGRLREEVDAMRATVIELLAAETPDRDAIRARQDDILALRRTIQDMVVEHVLAEKATLAPEQQIQFLEILRERSAHGDAGPPMSGKGWLDGRCRGSDVNQPKRGEP